MVGSWSRRLDTERRPRASANLASQMPHPLTKKLGREPMRRSRTISDPPQRRYAPIEGVLPGLGLTATTTFRSGVSEPILGLRLPTQI